MYPCKWEGCTTMADSKSNLRRHARHHSGEKVLACPFCARFFSRRDKLYDHCVRRTILMTEMEDPFLCKLCQKRFGTEKALCMHVTRHLVGHACPLCGLALATRSEIHRHLMTKHSSRTKDYKCDVCSKVFFTEVSLRHSKPSLKSNFQSELNRHAVFHSDVMYSCKQCDEKFKWKKQLLKHIKEHDEVRLQLTDGFTEVKFINFRISIRLRTLATCANAHTPPASHLVAISPDNTISKYRMDSVDSLTRNVPMDSCDYKPRNCSVTDKSKSTH